MVSILGLAKKITEAQINDIAFNDAIMDLQNNPIDENIQKFLRLYSKQIRTAKFNYNGKEMLTNQDVFDNIIKPIQKNNNFNTTPTSKGKRITFKGDQQFTFQNSTETKEVFKNNNSKEVNKALETNAERV